LPIVFALSCTYELRGGAGEIVSTGRITLEQRPAIGETIQLGSERAFVRDLQVGSDGPHLVLEPR
jgi:hypothetical protein